MPHTKSAKKSMRQIEKRRLRNKATKKGIKVQLKAVLAIVTDGPIDELKKQVNLAAKKLDKAAAKRVIHPNTAARKKSQLARMLRDKEKAPAAAAQS
jgi:small subunit ribosomal protein S20